jgi:hypothetical protein
VIARVAVWEPMPTDDRDWVIDAIAGIPGARAAYHLLDPETGNGLSIAIFDNETAGQAAGAAIRRRAEEIGWNDQPRPRFASETFYQVLRGHP